ncbi:MAG: hypothetical protein FWD48_03930 [Oscillospiraceae bacterium]|nr:hypothetical protein [Oscillospiraceae bacterium]
MKKIINRLRQKDGVSCPFVVCIVLVLLIITLGICEVIRVNIISANIRNKFQAVIISETTDNFVNMYQPLRDGYAGSHQNSGSGWQQSTLTSRNRIQSKLNEHFNNAEAGQLIISNVSFTTHSAPIAPYDANSALQFNVRGQVEVVIPFRFLWRNLPPMRLTVDVNSTWRQLF